MRILMVLDANDGRGMYRHGFFLAKRLAKYGHEVIVSHIDLEDGIHKEDEIKIYRISGFVQKMGFLYAQRNIRHHPPVPDKLVIKKLANIIRIEKPEILHAHGWVLYSAAKLRPKVNIPLVTTLHDYGYFCPAKDLLKDNAHICTEASIKNCFDCGKKHYGLIKDILTLFGVRKNFRLLNSSVNKFIAVSSYVKERYVNAGFPEDMVKVIPNFYNQEELETACHFNNSNLPDDFILYVGEFARLKGVDILIEAYGAINTNTKLVLIGRPKLKNLPNKKIAVYENPPRSLVVKAFSQCRFVVIPSICAEACPTVAFEAMACGKAVVATNNGGIKDIVIDNETGFLVPPEDADSLKNKIQYLLENRQEAELMGYCGMKQFYNKFTLDKVIPQIEDIYLSVQAVNFK